jgi:antiviral defense system Shedu protein SduA
VLDVYGEVIPKPNFAYPEGSSPLGKTFVQPDFLVRRHPSSYRLIELERPSKKMATKTGQSRAEVTQAVFQIAEFKDHILEHYDQLKGAYPGINRACSTTVIVSRATEESFGGRSDVRRQLQLLQQQHGVDELLTYDDLLVQAKEALARLSGLANPPSSS